MGGGLQSWHQSDSSGCLEVDRGCFYVARMMGLRKTGQRHLLVQKESLKAGLGGTCTTDPPSSGKRWVSLL